MSKNDKHIDEMNPEELGSHLANRMKAPFKTTKEEAWEQLSAKMSKPSKIIPLRSRQTINFPAAAVMLLILAFSFTRFFTKTYISENEAITFNTSDGSSVVLAPNSKASYKPLWMNIEREVSLEGEASFNVKKGDSFKVISEIAYTEVLGTTFVIKSAADNYHVSCFTGSVAVTDNKSKVSTILMANERVDINMKGDFDVRLIEEDNNTEIINNNYLTFQGLDVALVFSDIAVHFGAEIELKSLPELQYSGNLKKDESLENIIAAVCLSLDLEYEQLSNKRYIIKDKY